MPDRRVLSTWKEIAVYLARGVRTVQRWEIIYKLPVHRLANDSHSIYAFADEIDAWMNRFGGSSMPYVRPTLIVVDVIASGSLSDLKLALEGAKFNVLTAFTSAEVVATAARYDVDGFVVDAVLLDSHPADLGAELRRLYPNKLRVMVGDDPVENFDACIPAGDPGALVNLLISKFGEPQLTVAKHSPEDNMAQRSVA